MKFTYDSVGDILYIDLVPQYPEQESDMIADTVVARTNPQTGRVENFEILFFTRTLQAGRVLEVPVDPGLMPCLDRMDAAGQAGQSRDDRAAS